MLANLHKELQAAGIRLRLVAAHATVRDILRAEGLEERVGYFGRRISVADVIDEFQGKTGTRDRRQLVLFDPAYFRLSFAPNIASNDRSVPILQNMDPVPLTSVVEVASCASDRG